jgi:hypothetical protein
MEDKMRRGLRFQARYRVHPMRSQTVTSSGDAKNYFRA